jgi:hypothetical protein
LQKIFSAAFYYLFSLSYIVVFYFGSIKDSVFATTDWQYVYVVKLNSLKNSYLVYQKCFELVVFTSDFLILRLFGFYTWILKDKA